MRPECRKLTLSIPSTCQLRMLADVPRVKWLKVDEVTGKKTWRRQGQELEKKNHCEIQCILLEMVQHKIIPRQFLYDC